MVLPRGRARTARRSLTAARAVQHWLGAVVPCSPDPGDREDPAEREPRGAIGLRGIRRPEAWSQLGTEGGVLPSSRASRTGRRVVEPIHSSTGSGPGEALHVGRLPHVDVGRDTGEQRRVLGGLGHGGPVAELRGLARLPARGQGRATASGSCRAPAARARRPAGSAASQRGNSSRCRGHPVQHGVADHDVRVRRGRPVATSPRCASTPRSRAASTISAELSSAVDSGVRPTPAEQRGEVPGPAAEVDDTAGRGGGDPGEQVVERAGAVVAKARYAAGSQLVPDMSSQPLLTRARPARRPGRRGDDRRVRARVRPHLQHGAVASRDPALDEPGTAARQVPVVPAADRALDAGVHDLGDAARLDEAEPPGRPIGQQHRPVRAPRSRPPPRPTAHRPSRPRG